MKRYGWPLLGLLVTLATFLWINDSGGWRVGYSYFGDELQHIMMSQALLEDGHPFLPSRLNAPHTADWRSFPLFTPFELLFVWVFGKAGFDCFAATGLALYVNLILCFVTTYASLRALGQGRVISATFAGAFSLQGGFPMHNLSHPHALFAWTAPTALALMRIAEGDTKRQPGWLMFCLFAQGFGSLYMAFFTILLWLPASLLGYRLQGKKSLVASVKLGIVFAIGLLLHLICIADKPTPQGVMKSQERVTRRVSEAEHWGLKARNLLSPRPAHPIGILDKLERKIHSSFEEEPFDEGALTRCGTLFSIALILSVASLFKARPSSGALMAVATLGVAGAGGFAPIFNLFLVSTFRCYNRILPFLNFFAMAHLLSVWRPTVCGWLARLPRASVLLLIPIAAVDQFIPQNRAYPTRSFPAIAQLFENDRTWVQQVERLLPPSTMVYQMPYSAALAPPPDGTWISPNDPLIGYLHSRTLRWSWGALPRQAGWHRELEKKPLQERLKTVKDAGFGAVWLDRFGFPVDNYPVEDQLQYFLGRPIATSSNARYWLFKIPASLPAGPAPAQRNSEYSPPLDASLLPLRLAGPPKRAYFFNDFTHKVQVVVDNRSQNWLNGQGEHPVSVGYRWLQDGKIVLSDMQGTTMPLVPPGADRPLLINVRTPKQRGNYTLQIRLLQRQEFWLEAPEKVPPDIPVSVSWL